MNKIHLYLPTSLSLIPPGTEYRVLGEHQVWGNLPLIQTRTECPSLPVAPPECDSAIEGLDSCIVEWVIAEAPVKEPDHVDAAIDTLLVAAYTDTLATAEKLLAKAPLDNIVGLVNADGVERIAKVGE